MSLDHLLTRPRAGSVAGGPEWITVAAGDSPEKVDAPLHPRRLLFQMLSGLIAVLLLVGVVGSLAASKLAEAEAVNDAANTADVLAEAVIQPALVDEIAARQPAAVAAMDEVVRSRVLGRNVVRVKLWSVTGEVLYADEPQLIGQSFPLSEEQKSVLANPSTRAEVSTLDRAENAFEKSQEKLLEVYRPVWTPNGTELLFEMYAPYDSVTARSGQLWRGFAGVTLSSLLLLVVLMAPILWRLLDRLRRGQRQREELLQRAVDASREERGRIAASLHDGPVQELAATSFAVAGVSARARTLGHPELADELQVISGSVRSSMRGLRTLLVDIYPQTLFGAGLSAALTDLVGVARSRNVVASLELAPDVESTLTIEHQQLAYRVAQECLRNIVKHAAPCHATVSFRAENRSVVMEISDDGPGFDAEAALTAPSEGHFGLRVLADLTSSAGATLDIAAAPGYGTHWRLVIPTVQGPAGSAE